MEVAKETKFSTFTPGGENDSRSSNTRIAQRKCMIPHSAMKNNLCNIIECCNTLTRALHTGKQTNACASDLGDGSHVACEKRRVLRRDWKSEKSVLESVNAIPQILSCIGVEWIC